MFKISPRLASAETIFFFLACESGSFEQEVDHMEICGGVSGRREIKRGSPLAARLSVAFTNWVHLDGF